MLLVLVALMSTAATLAVAPLSFIGLMTPHLARRSGAVSIDKQLPVAALCGAASVGVAHAADNTTLAPVTIAADKSRVASEDTRDYTVPTMTSATGMALSAQETPQTVSVVTQQQMRD